VGGARVGRSEYRIATNPGEPLKPLDEIASGGEMSRVMLALKVAWRGVGKVRRSRARIRRRGRWSSTRSTSASAGGRPRLWGSKLKVLSKGQQVLCVTHLPQIAAFADQHFLVDKREADGRTKTQVRLLDDRARTHEVARMLSGAKVTETSCSTRGR
jgi:DNA repair protein RecN (Recombination protein N)